jgi:hypothetical protein
MRPGRPAHFLVVFAFGAATIALGLVLGLGPLVYGIGLLRGDAELAGWFVTVAGAAWLIALGRTILPGLLAGAVHSIFIFARLVKDPWEGERP